jgi:hypothetical protein
MPQARRHFKVTNGWIHAPFRRDTRLGIDGSRCTGYTSISQKIAQQGMPRQTAQSVASK